MKLTQIKVTCKTEDIERVSAIMSVVDVNLMIEDYSDIEELDTCYGELIAEELISADRTHASVSLFLEDGGDPTDALSFITERFEKEGIEAQTEVIPLDDSDWENEWKKYYEPVHIGSHIVIVPAWQEYDPAPGELTVKMDPGLAFGTGTHETTRLCAALLEKYLQPGDDLLDVGTGSGILSIIAKKMGAGCVTGCDLDPVAVRVAAENAADNGCEIDFFASDLLSEVKGQYRVITANIVSDIIIRMAKDVRAFMKPGGVVLLSGIIDTREAQVDAAMRAAGLTQIDRICENDWRGLAYRIKSF